jgi:hypothetical protein
MYKKGKFHVLDAFRPTQKNGAEPFGAVILEHLAELRQSHFVLDDFFFGTHLTFSFHACGASLPNVRSGRG